MGSELKIGVNHVLRFQALKFHHIGYGLREAGQVAGGQRHRGGMQVYESHSTPRCSCSM